MILLSGNSDLLSAILVCVGLIVVTAIIGYLYSCALDAKDTLKEGGIKGIYPNVVKFIMLNYPNTRVVSNSSLFMRIVSIDKEKDVTMFFSLWLNVANKNLKIKGSINPGNKWAWIPPKKFQWCSEAKYGTLEECEIIEKIKNDMIFNPKQ